MFRSILLPTDGSAFSERIIPRVEQLLTEQKEGRVCLLQVLPPGENAEGEFRAATQQLSDLQQSFERRGLHATYRVERGDPVEMIVNTIETTRPDLVAMATHGRTGLTRLVRGSVSEGVLRHCTVPLLVCNTHTHQGTEPSRFHRILIALDGSKLADGMLPLAREMSLLHGAEAVLFYAAPNEGAAAARRIELEARAHEFEGTGIPKVELDIRVGEPAKEILLAVERNRADLLAMSTHGRTGFSRLRFGSVTEAVLREVPCPLLLRRSGLA